MNSSKSKLLLIFFLFVINSGTFGGLYTSEINGN